MKHSRALLVILIATVTFAPAAFATPKNIIIMIGDGMGPEEVKAAAYYVSGAQGSLSFESFPQTGNCTTAPSGGGVTDSAAAATAIATGHKVNNGVISVALPGDGSDLQTLLEYFRDEGKSTGLVTTTYMTHATPAGFGAHTSDRGNTSNIATDYISQTRPNVLFGGGANGMSVSAAQTAGYTVVTNRTEMDAVDTETATYVSGQFGTSHLPYEYDYFTGSDNGYDTLPHLSEMVTTALAILDNDPDGFFLMVEGGRIDHAGHENNIQRNVFETIEFSNTVQEVADWEGGRYDTLIIVTADHETGGLTVTGNNGAGNFPSVTWSTTGHTGINVPVYATGPNSEMISGTMDNTGFFPIAIAVTEASAPMMLMK